MTVTLTYVFEDKEGPTMDLNTSFAADHANGNELKIAVSAMVIMDHFLNDGELTHELLQRYKGEIEERLVIQMMKQISPELAKKIDQLSEVGNGS